MRTMYDKQQWHIETTNNMSNYHETQGVAQYVFLSFKFLLTNDFIYLQVTCMEQHGEPPMTCLTIMKMEK